MVRAARSLVRVVATLSFASAVAAQCEVAKLSPTAGAAGDQFGRSIAVSGNRLVVGAPDDDQGGTDSGAAYVFEEVGGAWVQTAKLVASDAANFDSFGFLVDVDGDRIVVGSIFDDDAGFDSGSAYVFEYDGASWVESQKLVPSDGAIGDLFGVGVALDGTRLLVGACQETQFNTFGTGAGYAYVYEEVGGAFVEDQKLESPVGLDGDLFGETVSLQGDRALVGGGGRDDNGARSGAGYVWEKQGANWVETALLTASDASAGDFFGVSSALDGDRAVFGAPFHDGVASQAGAAYVFEYDGATWNEVAVLTSPTQGMDDQVGIFVALDGDLTAFGGYSFTGASSGHAYVHQRDAGGSWSEVGEFVGADSVAGDGFGYAVRLDGDRIFASALSDDGTGSAYEFRWSPASVTVRDAGTNPSSLSASSAPVLGQSFGLDVDLGGTTGHALGAVVGYAGGLTLPLAGGQTLLVDITDPAGELLGQALTPGPLASWSLGIPDDVSLCGFDVSVQGVHVGGVSPFALSNALDLVLGH